MFVSLLADHPGCPFCLGKKTQVVGFTAIPRAAQFTPESMPRNPKQNKKSAHFELYFKRPTTQSGPICHYRKALWEINGGDDSGMLAKQNTENIISLEALRISGISNTPRDGKWATTHNAAPFRIRNDSRLSRQARVANLAHFHLERRIALWAQGKQRHDSIRREVPET